jgi:hypothetical protein
MKKLPQGKALLYLAVVRCRIDFERPSLTEFLQTLSDWFPLIFFQNPLSYIQEYIDSIPSLPASVVKGTYTKTTLQKFLKESGLQDLHDHFEKQQFKDLMFHSELRHKIDGMMIGRFHIHEIEAEVNYHIPGFDPVILRTYIDCFANYYGINFIDLRTFITNTFEELQERNDLLKSLETKEKKHIRSFLGLKSPSFDPIEAVYDNHNVIARRLRIYVRDDNDPLIQDYLGWNFKAADALYKMGAGSKDAAAELLAELKKLPDDPNVPKPPKAMSVDELNDLRLEKVLAPTSPLTL